MCSKLLQCILLLLPIIPQVWSTPISVLQNDHPPLAAEISSRLSSHAGRLQEPKLDSRLPLPTPQDIETIRRIAEVLVTLGQQVIPSIIGPSPGTGGSTTMATVTEIPNDIVNLNLQK
ncbi:unnamed protein product, partial [Brenthis ino]